MADEEKELSSSSTMIPLDALRGKKLTSDTTWYDDAQLEHLKQDPHNMVYDPKDRIRILEPWQKMTAQQADAFGDKVRHTYLALRERFPNDSDDRLRERLRAEGKQWESFANKSHTNMFRMLTCRTTGKREIGVLKHLATTRARVEHGELTEAQAATEVQDYLLRQCREGK